MEENRDLIEFNGTQVKVLIKNNTIEIEMNELAKAIGYADVIGIKKLIDSNPELKNKEFSYLKKVDSIENGIIKKREKRVFTEDGLYEVSMLANTEISKKFRRRIREIMKQLRTGNLILQTPGIQKQQLQLDEMIDLIKSRDEEIKSFLEMFEQIRNSVEDIKLMKTNMDIIIKSQDEMAEAINSLIDEVYGKDDEE
ncbi:hypothetical protein CTN00_03175 [Fusobacterium pseudoperiodonticum]|uniref:hypothetical protein n=1 Tax=Fusobacterium pseudoperiodonticum TaxID=2663009 RepID=UPI000C1C64CB|nr:hypothetical protein [Fusobacterium pseudoperiodonticum]ATV73515.1 hypothetical protein CTN00_03175 [Fusobacterium pseudoperiodonticum]